jgi:hypothetical protein
VAVAGSVMLYVLLVICKAKWVRICTRCVFASPGHDFAHTISARLITFVRNEAQARFYSTIVTLARYRHRLRVSGGRIYHRPTHGHWNVEGTVSKQVRMLPIPKGEQSVLGAVSLNTGHEYRTEGYEVPGSWFNRSCRVDLCHHFIQRLEKHSLN